MNGFDTMRIGFHATPKSLAIGLDPLQQTFQNPSFRINVVVAMKASAASWNRPRYSLLQSP